MTKKYELIYVLNGTLRADELKAQMERVHGIVEASGEIVDIVEWGRRRLAYEIQDLREGYYVLVYFNAAPEAPREIERLLRIYDPVLRFLIVVAEGVILSRQDAHWRKKSLMRKRQKTWMSPKFRKSKRKMQLSRSPWLKLKLKLKLRRKS
jgi:small subunit ribosomal protein S6